MKILFIGGGTGGHFYPIIAVARAIHKIAEEERIVNTELYFAADKPLDKSLLESESIEFITVPAGKIRRYISPLHLIDAIKTLSGIIWALWRLYFLMPDVVFSKGGYSSFPVLVASRFLKIPVVIHESDVIPGMVNKWSGKWADRIAISFSDTVQYFPGKNVALTGNPIRSQVVGGNLSEAIQTFNLEEGLPTVLFLGGSQGSEKVNETLMSIIKEMVENFQIIHQTGPKNFDDISGVAAVILEKTKLKHRYHVYPFLDEGLLRSASRAASVIVARSGSMLFEIAAWGLPSILIPLPGSAQDHQRKNAYAYARTGACMVIEETNLTPHLLLEEIANIVNSPEKIKKMQMAAQTFSKLDAAEKIAREILNLGVH
ncbi:UDP-N-acetylglucosamine--N-acetylmuramyl-(pentapeptide) pyrophosphoryl-undecaprenol N-acetylglucosamine transferase [Candidatus Giovannonibacteria bacterium]|nr:UDP-N-acetylglucosamine--N-acetylmuramyl-(pentapeptide) pyrophosphoryl-undecaprenol N-acetylglucosamine transferase [Candidatus Giovannonibacteria bacterium]